MYTDISHLSLPLPQDNLSVFFQSLDINITGFGTWDQSEVGVLSNFMITDYEIIYMLKGESELTYKGKTHIIKSGDIVLFEPFQLYSAQCIAEEKVRYVYIHFHVEPYIIQQELVEMLRGDGSPIYRGDSFLSFYFMMQNICTPAERALEGHSLLLKFALTRILLAMVRQRKDLSVKYEIPQFNSQETDIVKQAVNYVMENINKPIKISQVATTIGVSENKMYKCFIDILKVSPSKYFMQLKIKKAKDLLCSTNMSIDEISFATGFSSAFHFSKTFKDTLGMTPSSIRKFKE